MIYYSLIKTKEVLQILVVWESDVVSSFSVFLYPELLYWIVLFWLHELGIEAP
jgi:hypothetical protein